MKTSVLLFFFFLPFSMLGQPAPQDSLRVVADSTQKNLINEIKELADSVAEQKGMPESAAVSEVPLEVIDRLEEMVDSLRQSAEEDQGPVTSIDNFKTEFIKVWEGLIETLDLTTIMVILSLILSAALFSYLLRRYVRLRAGESTRRRLGILRWFPVANLIIWVFVAVGPILYIILSNPKVMWPVLAAIALVLGISAKDSVSDLLSGLWLIFERPFQIGDRIRVGEYYGEVKSIKIRSTQINTLDDNLVTIPNSKILSDSIANANAGHSACMVVIEMVLPLKIDVKKIRKIAYEATITSPYLNYNEPVIILFSDFFEERPGTKLSIKAYVFDARYEKAFASDVAEAVKQAFVETGVYNK